MSDLPRILSDALDRPESDRSAFLDGACGSNASLRAEVEALIKAHESADSFLDKPLVTGPAVDSTVGTVLSEGPGTVIDKYKLLQLIGEGGFGAVYMAEQREPVKRRIALKIIKLGMDTKQVIARFEAERQALAMMDHPNIARVLDAGATETGRPYFVMELVKGVSITEYCDTENLTTKDRLDLFISVCNAVQHAHQKGIIHRDLKPSNVMVTLHDGKPVPKVIDFGIAKATNRELTDKTLFTEYRQFIGTPEYMSPEQAEMSGLDIDTRSDIYSLGVLLYELLTGVTPFDGKRLRSAAINEVQRIIREEEPSRPSTRLSELSRASEPSPPGRGQGEGSSASRQSSIQYIAKHRRTDPSSLARQLRGDLDWIIMKALEKDRSRRYETANGFAADIHRYLSDEPVTATPPSTSYRLRKLIKRNKGAFAAAAIVFVVLTLGATGTTIGMLRAMDAEERAAVEAANTQFRLRFTRIEAARAVDELGKVVWQARRAQDYSYFVPEHIRSQYPDDVSPDFDVWLGQVFPELGPTTWDAVDSGVRLPASVVELLDTYAETPDDAPNEKLYEWTRENRGRLRLLVDQIGEGDPVVAVTWRSGRPLWEGIFPSLRARKQAAALLGAYAVTCHLDGDRETAVAVLTAARGLARATGSSGYILTALADVGSRYGFYALTRWMIIDALRRGECPEAYIRLVIEDPPIQSMDAGMRFEALAARQAAGELFAVRERDGQPRFDMDLWGELREFYDDPPGVKAGRLDLDTTLNAIDEALETYLRVAAEPGLELRIEEPPAIELLRRPEVAFFLMPRLTNTLRIWARTKRQRDATIITAALAAHHCRHGTWPANLDTALAGFVVQPVRRDYFGRDFRYRIEGDNEPLLYSIGPNQSDDGGDMAGVPPLDEVYLRPRLRTEADPTNRDG